MSTSYAILTDTTLCIGCEKCVQACKEENSLGKDLPRRWQKNIDDLSSTRYTTILRHPGEHFVRQQCRHCLEPACVSACLVGAMKKTDQGPVIYDGDRCMGCRYCMMACPYGIPRYDWDKAVPYVRKCTMCYHRVSKGKLPACVEACPEKATIFGSRGDLLKEAKIRITTNPERYQKKIYGETEIGGTSVLYISDIPLDFLAFKSELGNKPLPERTMAALSKVPPLILGMGGLMTSVWWFVGRRMKIAAEVAAKNEAGENEVRSPNQVSKTDEESQP